MSLAVWKERVLLEYKKLNAFASIERANQIKAEWKENFNKLEEEINQKNELEVGKEKLLKWHNPTNADTAVRYLKECKPIPRGNKWILVNKNEKCPLEEENVLYNVPYTNDEVDEGFVTDLLRNYNDKIANNQPPPLMKDNMLVELVDRLKKNYATTKQEKMFSNCKTIIFKAISYHFYDKISPKILMNKYDDLVKNVTCVVKSESVENNGIVNSGRDRLAKIFCPRCFKYSCLQHSNSDSTETKINKKQQSNDHEITQKPTQPCGSDCFLNMETVASNDKHLEPCTSMQATKRRRLFLKVETEEWHSDDLELFRTLINVFKDNYCIIAKSMISKSCKQVFELSMKEKSEARSPIFNSSPIIRKVSRATKNRALYSAHMKANDMNKLYPYIPCNHGNNLRCNENCTCLGSKNFCEKFCKCHSEICLNRFIGCKCKSNCDTKKCLCYSYGRECDPDICKTCGASELKNKATLCKNINIQRGIRKHLLLSRSDVAGWGIFLKSSAKRNEFITEYCGEIITQKEANRRGKLYDKAKSSFLFDLNEEYVIDATRMGSKIRFANHSNKPNCYAKVINVSGDHRIGIFAKRNIKPGEELCFDYKYGPTERLSLLSNDL